MRIGIIIGRIGGIDGVALETEKWIDILEKQGHKIYILTGKLQNMRKHVTIVRELDFHHPLTIREQTDAYYKQKVQEETVMRRILRNTDFLESQILTWLVKNKIDVILSENASALPCHLSMGLAIQHVLEKTGIPCVTHDHDFYWERGDRYQTRYPSVRKIMEKCFPTQLPHVRHAVINKHGQDTLKERFGIDSMVVPNVMDFNQPYGLKDEFNSTLPESLKLKKADIPIFQITRIVRRKGIETAIKLVSELDDPNVKLIVTGGGLDDYNANYYGELIDLVDELELENQVLFAETQFSNDRKIEKRLVADMTQEEIRAVHHRKKRYSLSDAYAFAKVCTYFSTYEGFGNAFVECVLAKRPIFVNNYKPVYWPDIGSLGFETVMLEDNNLTPKAIADMKEIIYNDKRAKEIAEHNFELGKKHFSYEVLDELLEKLFAGIE